jgi:hypothetical protein
MKHIGTSEILQLASQEKGFLGLSAFVFSEEGIRVFPASWEEVVSHWTKEVAKGSPIFLQKD